MLWHEWLRVILFFGLLMAIGVYLFIGLMDELFPTPNIFDKAIDAIYKRFYCKSSKYPKAKPW